MNLGDAMRLIEVAVQTDWTDTPIVFPLQLPADQTDPSVPLLPQGDENYLAFRYLFDESHFVTVPGTVRRMHGQVHFTIYIREDDLQVSLKHRTYLSKIIELFEGREILEAGQVLRFWGVSGAAPLRFVGWVGHEIIFSASFERCVPGG